MKAEYLFLIKQINRKIFKFNFYELRNYNLFKN